MKRIILLAAAALIVSGCAAHRIQYYQLSAFDKQAALAESGPVLVVGRIATPQALQDGRIRYREGAHEVGAYEYHRWTDPPGMMVRESLIHALRASGKYKSVHEAASSTEGDYLIRGKLLEFDEIDSPAVQTRVALDLELRDSKTGRLLWNKLLTHNDSVDAKKVADVVHSLDQGLRAVLEEATSSIATYVAEHPRASR